MRKPDIHAARRRRLLRRFRRAGVDALLVTKAENVRYLTGFGGDDSAALVTPDRTALLTDSRYAEQAGQETRRIAVVTRRNGMMRTAARAARKAGVGRLGVEADHLALALAEDLRSHARGMEVISCRGLVEALRAVKDRHEVAAIRRALEIAEEAFRLTLRHVRPGRTEREIALLLERTMQDLGAEGAAFPPIVAAGERSSLPHARPTGQRIRKGEAVLFDWGARWNGYHSDLTRMVFLDRIPRLFQGIYPLVLAAQQRAISRIRPGRTTGSVDAAARGHLRRHRHGKHFGHGLGHGVGLEIHEGPGLRPGHETVFRAGMVCTVEPGVYLPGRGGVRIEDMVLVTRKGHVTLSSLPRTPAAFLIRR